MLHALAQGFIDDATGCGRATQEQIADASQYSVRHVRTCLEDLEALGIIEWTRGGRRRGKGIPSFFKIIKTKLVELIKAARKLKDERVRARAAVTAERLSKASPAVRFGTVNPKRAASSHRKVQPEMPADLLTSYEGGDTLHSEGGYQFDPETSLADRQLINVAAQRAHDEAQWQNAYGAQGASMADGSADGGTATHALDPRALVSSIAPAVMAMVAKSEEAKARKLRRKQHGR